MKDFRKILVPFDGSEHAKRALTRAIYLAELCGAKLGLLYVVDLNKKISALEQVSTGGYVPSELKEEGYQVLASAIHQVPKEVEADNAVEIGRPSEVIIETCRAGKYDLIVMGSRGLGNIQQLFMGSVSRYALYHADCPVMITR
ncbi:TRAP-T-associated universal stress protein TeaD [bioreactor metagenome]|uniref:TRAP-T-associated universal stress protein TeaD n=1 Tax=bioreactor metagenome TaxID=1076179 RepID=A0A645DMC1_9ZZZZ